MKKPNKSSSPKRFVSSTKFMSSDLLFLLARPYRAIVKRWGPTWLKSMVWHQEFKRGQFLHDLKSIGRSRICNDIERYSNNGDILDLGCSDGHVGLGLELEKYNKYIGVDISEIGIREAFEKCRLSGKERSEKNSFHVGDISKYTPSSKFNVIMFKDSLYYINRLNIIKVLKRNQQYLMPNGVFIVEMDNIRRHEWIRDLIRTNFTVIEDNEETVKDFMVLIFR